MPRAEVGSTKWLSNKMTSKGLQRLRWYCQPCEKQCRDANGFKCHVQSESHVRQMHIVGEDPRKFIEKFSTEFKHDFLQQLRVAHGEKFINANRFYQEYIANKEHIHMNATKWPSLTEFVKYLGREGVCNVKEDEKDGLCIAWRDTSSAAVMRREAIRQAEHLDNRNENQEERMMKKMIQRAKQEEEVKKAQAKAAESKSPPASVSPEKDVESKPEPDGETAAAPEPEAPKAKIGFSLKSKPVATTKPGLGVMKSQSIFKRARTTGGEEKPAKKLKI